MLLLALSSPVHAQSGVSGSPSGSFSYSPSEYTSGSPTVSVSPSTSAVPSITSFSPSAYEDALTPLGSWGPNGVEIDPFLNFV